MSRRNKFRYQPPMTNTEFTSAILRDILDREPRENRSNDIPVVTILSKDEARAMARKALLQSDAVYYSRRG